MKGNEYLTKVRNIKILTTASKFHESDGFTWENVGLVDVNYHYFSFNFLFATVFFLIILIIGIFAGFELPKFGTFKILFAICAVSAFFAWFYTKVRKEPNVAQTALGLFSFGLFLKPAMIFSYAALRLDGTKIDDELLAFDKFIGFDWAVVAPLIAEYPAFLNAMSSIYTSSIYITIISIFVVGMFYQRPKQLHQFFTAIMICGVIGGLCGGLFPVDGVYRDGIVSAEVIKAINPIVGPHDFVQINELRYGPSLSLDIRGGIGVIGMPSFHTIISALLIWMARECGWFFVISLVWNVGIILTVPVMGNHYVADVFGGLITSLIAVWATYHIYAMIDKRHAVPVGA